MYFQAMSTWNSVVAPNYVLASFPALSPEPQAFPEAPFSIFSPSGN